MYYHRQGGLKMRRLNLELSEEAYQNLEKLRKAMDKTSKAEVIRSGVALLDLMHREKKNGNSLGVIGENGEPSTKIASAINADIWRARKYLNGLVKQGKIIYEKETNVTYWKLKNQAHKPEEIKQNLKFTRSYCGSKLFT